MTPARVRAKVARRLERLEAATRAAEQQRHVSQRVWRPVDIAAVLRQIADVAIAGERLLAALAEGDTDEP